MTDDPLSTTFAALADPTRRAILTRLAESEATVNDLAEPFTISLQAVSRHLKVLEKAGLISRGRDAQYRPCRFRPEPLDEVVGWVDRHRQVWTERFDQLEVHLKRLQSVPDGRGRADRTTTAPPGTPEPSTPPEQEHP
jgi:DNA-binding transcriptional ArsR family regulator